MKRVLITGGSRGIGAACVRKFTALGDCVSFIYNKSEERAAILSAQTGALSVHADVADAEALRRVPDGRLPVNDVFAQHRRALFHRIHNRLLLFLQYMPQEGFVFCLQSERIYATI